MQCSNWIQNGLLYTAGELSVGELAHFKAHLESCGSCRRELEIYVDEKSRFFTSDILLDNPSPETDRKIREACMKIPRPISYTAFLSFSLRKIALPTVFLFIGLGVPIYVAYNINDAHQNAIAHSKATKTNPSPKTELILTGTQPSEIDSLQGDSIVQGNRPEVLKPMGDMTKQGVIPVDLRNR
jgi:hypothetical protein